jgi:hypothetical protein
MDKEDELQRLIDEHKTCTTERAKTACENKLWELAKTNKGITAKRPSWLEMTLGYKESYKHRETLKDAPPAFWDYVEATNLELPRAILLWKEVLAKKDVHKIPLTNCLQIIINNRTERKEAKTKKSSDKIPKITVIQDGWSDLQQALEKCLTPILTVMSPDQKIKYIPKLNRSIQLAIATLYSALKRDADAIEAIPVSITELKEACNSLQVNIPEFKKLVDLEEAKKNKRILLYMVHPDQSSTPDLGLYQEYLRAYDTLEKYNSQITTLEEKEKQHG